MEYIEIQLIALRNQLSEKNQMAERLITEGEEIREKIEEINKIKDTYVEKFGQYSVTDRFDNKLGLNLMLAQEEIKKKINKMT